MNTTVKHTPEMENLVRKASEHGIELEFSQTLIPEKHESSLWYGGEIAVATYKGLKFYLEAHGDVEAYLLDEEGNIVEEVKDRNNLGEFVSAMRLINNDEELTKMISYEHPLYRLGLVNNNWFEWFIVDVKTGEEICPEGIVEDDEDLYKILSAEELLTFFEWAEEELKDEIAELTEKALNEAEKALNEAKMAAYIANRSALHEQLSELQADLEDLNDEDLVKCRECMLERINLCMELILETDEDNI